MGFENISANNGWTMAAVGASIVFAGLVLLSLTIAQLHKILGLWDRRDVWLEKLKNRSEASPKESLDITLSADDQETLRNFKMLTQRIGDPFALPKLLALSEKCGLAKPHAAINRLLTAKIIVPDGRGYFQWRV